MDVITLRRKRMTENPYRHAVTVWVDVEDLALLDVLATSFGVPREEAMLEIFRRYAEAELEKVQVEA
jgi:hypothetical protein